MLGSGSRHANVSVDPFFEQSADVLSPIEVSREPFDGYDTPHLDLGPYSKPKINSDLQNIQRMGRWRGDEYFQADVPSTSQQWHMAGHIAPQQ